MATGDLTTLAKVRAQLKLTTLDADDLLGQLITSSSAWICSQIGRPVLSATYTEYYDGDGGQRLVLRHWPIVSVTSVTADGAAIPARPSVSGDGYVIEGSALQLSPGYFFPYGTQNIAVVYVAGYASVPTDLEQACIEHVSMKFRQADRQGLSSASGSGESVVFDANREWASIQGLLDPYREASPG